jgi:hypothetical protein
MGGNVLANVCHPCRLEKLSTAEGVCSDVEPFNSGHQERKPAAYLCCGRDLQISPEAWNVQLQVSAVLFYEEQFIEIAALSKSIFALLQDTNVGA